MDFHRNRCCFHFLFRKNFVADFLQVFADYRRFLARKINRARNYIRFLGNIQAENLSFSETIFFCSSRRILTAILMTKANVTGISKSQESLAFKKR